MTQTQPLKIFLAYADKDEKYLDKVLNTLKSSLASFVKQGLVSFWDKRQIVAGTDRTRVFNENLQNAQLVLLLFSADFMVSDFMNNDTYIQNLLERSASTELQIIPIRLRPMNWDDDSPFANLDHLPTGKDALNQWTREDDALYNIGEGVKKAVKIRLGMPEKQSGPTGNSPVPASQQLLKERQVELQGSFNVLSNLIKALQQAFDYEPNPQYRMQFDNQLKQKKAEREEVVAELAEIERQLS